MVKLESPALTWIRWVDSSNLFQDRWATMEDLDQHDDETYCETVGWLIAHNDHSLYMASSKAPEEIGSVMQIPRVAVKERRELDVGWDRA